MALKCVSFLTRKGERKKNEKKRKEGKGIRDKQAQTSVFPSFLDPSFALLTFLDHLDIKVYCVVIVVVVASLGTGSRLT